MRDNTLLENPTILSPHFGKGIDVLKKIHGKVVDHPNYLRTVEQVSETQIRYVFAHRDDAERKLFLTVLAFEVPV